MGDIFEEVVASWLQINGYFIMQNIKYGFNNEIDILATKLPINKVIHIEVSCSSNPVGILGTNKAGEKNYERFALEYLEKKFFNQRVLDRINEISNKIQIERWFIHAKLKEPKQLEIIQKKDIKTIPIDGVISDIKKSKLNVFSGDKRLKQLLDIIK